jgi:predicted anti-sigma-YlaC factor YlaD
MHRQMRDQVEQVLTGTSDVSAATHLDQCADCREQIAGMREQAGLLRELRTGGAGLSDAEPRAGFYARVMERIEAQGAESIWSMFFDSPLGRRVAMASMALALCVSVYVVSSEQMASRGAAPVSRAAAFTNGPDAFSPDSDTVLVNLVTYRGQ